MGTGRMPSVDTCAGCAQYYAECECGLTPALEVAARAEAAYQEATRLMVEAEAAIGAILATMPEEDQEEAAHAAEVAEDDYAGGSLDLLAARLDATATAVESIAMRRKAQS